MYAPTGTPDACAGEGLLLSEGDTGDLWLTFYQTT